ncbi:hypothetical protein HDU85_007008 [Gaertneriomyces sp. JEL0708]|nr:hypothetical protein HDU85_007008 [Gaertneriomyces sp. JEL0708]
MTKARSGQEPRMVEPDLPPSTGTLSTLDPAMNLLPPQTSTLSQQNFSSADSSSRYPKVAPTASLAPPHKAVSMEASNNANREDKLQVPPVTFTTAATRLVQDDSYTDRVQNLLASINGNNPAAAASSLLMLSNQAQAHTVGPPTAPKPVDLMTQQAQSSAAISAQLAAIYPQLAAIAASDPYALVRSQLLAASLPHLPYQMHPAFLPEAVDRLSAVGDVARQGGSDPSHDTHHSEMHINIQPNKDGKYACDMCDRTFSRQYNLKSHIKTHQNHRPFVCNVCDLRFTRNHDLNRHLKTHSKDKPHICNSCGRKFARRDALRRHERMDSEGKKIHCNMGADRSVSAEAAAVAVAHMLPGPVQEAIHAALVGAAQAAAQQQQQRVGALGSTGSNIPDQLQSILAAAQATAQQHSLQQSIHQGIQQAMQQGQALQQVQAHAPTRITSSPPPQPTDLSQQEFTQQFTQELAQRLTQQIAQPLAAAAEHQRQQQIASTPRLQNDVISPRIPALTGPQQDHPVMAQARAQSLSPTEPQRHLPTSHIALPHMTSTAQT